MDLFDLAIASKLSGGGGGGGGDFATLLKTWDVGHIKHTATSATDLGQETTVNVEGYDVLLSVAVSDSTDNAYHVLSVVSNNLYGSYRDIPSKSYTTANGPIFKRTSSGYQTTSNMQGVWGAVTGVTDNIATVKLYGRFNSTNTGTIDANYTVYLFGLDFSKFIGE